MRPPWAPLGPHGPQLFRKNIFQNPNFLDFCCPVAITLQKCKFWTPGPIPMDPERNFAPDWRPQTSNWSILDRFWTIFGFPSSVGLRGAASGGFSGPKIDIFQISRSKNSEQKSRFGPRDPSRKIRTEILVKFRVGDTSRSFMAIHLVTILSKLGWMRVPGPARTTSSYFFRGVWLASP